MATNTTDPNATNGVKEPVRFPARKKKPFTAYIIPVLALIAAGMLFFAVPNIITGTDTQAGLKALLLAAAAAVVAYAVNRLAIERGAPLAAIGFPGAAALSVGAMIAVGGGLYGATYSGLTILDVETLRQEQQGGALSEYVGKRTQAAARAVRVQPAMRVIANDLEAKARCEVANSCVSGRAGGGRGPVARVLEEKSARAAAITGELEAGDVARIQAIAQLNRLLEEYQRVLGDTDKGVWERRAGLQIVDASIRQAAGALDEAIPLSLLSAYAAELQGGAALADHPAAARRLNATLVAHGQSLAAVLASIDRTDAVQPAFPPRTGVSDTFSYIGHFLPVAVIVAVVELIFPLVLWFYTFWAIGWRNYKADPTIALGDSEHDSALEAISDRAASLRHANADTVPSAPPAAADTPTDDVPARLERGRAPAPDDNRRRRRNRRRSGNGPRTKLNGAANHDQGRGGDRYGDDTGERDDVR
ncbi:MAG: hypothetical protein WDZ83_20495 [Rhizobiaceae bacterium]